MNVHDKAAVFLASLLAIVTLTQPLAHGANPPVTAPAAAAAASGEAAIRAGGQAWDIAYQSLKADALAALYAEDAVLLAPTAKSAKGRAAIRKYLAEYLPMFREGRYTPIIGKSVEITVSGDFGFRSGTYTVTDKAGATVDTGKWLEIWRKSGDKWYIVRDMWNSDMLPLFAPDPPPG